MIALFAALLLTFEVGDTWYAQENVQGVRLFKQILCEVPRFRQYVVFHQEQKNFDFVFVDTGGQAWVDSRRVILNPTATEVDCNGPLWQASELWLLNGPSGFEPGATFVWLNMHRDEVGLLITRFQLTERLYSWSMGCLIACVVICILGSSVFALGPPNSCAMKTQLPAFLVAILLLIIGVVLFVAAHSDALHGQASFSVESREDSQKYTGLFFILPISLIFIILGWGSTVFVQLQHNTPVFLAWLPGIYHLFDKDNQIEVDAKGHSLHKVVERDV